MREKEQTEMFVGEGVNWSKAELHIDLAKIATRHGRNDMVTDIIVEHLRKAIEALSPLAPPQKAEKE